MWWGAAGCDEGFNIGSLYGGVKEGHVDGTKVDYF